MKKERARLGFIASMVIFGTVGVFVRGIGLGSGVIASARGLAGAVFLVIFALARRQKLSLSELKSSLVPLIISGAAMGFNWILLFEAYKHTTVATATLCYYLAPVIVVLSSPVFFGEKLTGKTLLCAGAAFVGMIFVSGVVESGIPDVGELTGILLALGAAVLYAAVMIINKRMGDVPAYERTAVQLGIAGAALLPYCALTGGVDASGLTALSLALLAVVCIVHTGVAYVMYFGSMDHLPAKSVSILGYIDPVVAVICSVAILREPFSVWSLIGMALIIGAAIVSERK